MAIGAIIKDGQIVETASQTSVSSAASTSSTNSTNGYDKDSFLQLLVAQMKYQDPLEPTSNTEYISQYATFSQVEQLQNMSSTMELSRASAYVGKLVQISSTDSHGDVSTLEGTVDFIKYENGKAYVSIEGNLYSADDITAVVDDAYADSMELVENFAKAVNSLPSLADITTKDAENIEALVNVYNGMTAYEQSMLDDSYYNQLKTLYDRVAELKAAEESNNETNESGTEAGTENSGNEVTA